MDDGRLVPPGWLQQAPVTVGLIGLNACAFLVEVAFSHDVSEISTGDSLTLGASYWLATLHEHRFETLVTACFLHAGIVHLLFNMLALWQAGPIVERMVGSARMAPMYLVAGAAGNVLSVSYMALTRSQGMSVGASGAIAGVLGAALVVCWRVAGWRSPMTQAMFRWLAFVIGFGVVMNVTGGNIDNAAHIGGALTGAAIAALWKRNVVYSPFATRSILGGCLAVVAACAATVAVRDRDPYASLLLHDRIGVTIDALKDGDCPDARAGLMAIERLRTKVAEGHKLRETIEEACGPVPAP